MFAKLNGQQAGSGGMKGRGNKTKQPSAEAQTPLKKQQLHRPFDVQDALSLCFSCSIAARKTQETKLLSRTAAGTLHNAGSCGHFSSQGASSSPWLFVATPKCQPILVCKATGGQFTMCILLKILLSVCRDNKLGKPGFLHGGTVNLHNRPFLHPR